MSKKLVISLTVLMVAIGVILAIVFMPVSKSQSAANQFFSLIRSGQLQEAYDKHTSAAVQDIIPFTAFQSSLEPLKDYRKISWDALATNEGTTTLQGILTSAAGTDFNLEVTLLQENDQWKIHYVTYKLKLVDVNNMPAESELKKLAGDSMLLFVDAVTTEDFADFYGNISDLWQRQITADSLKDAFKQFFPIKNTLVFIKTSEPIIDTNATKITNGILAVNGHYESDTNNILFELGYVLGDSQWKLVNINVKIATQ